MDVIKEFFDEHGNELTEKLEGAGFSVEQARDFLPEAVESILSSTQSSGIAHAISALLDGPSQLLESIDTDEIAKKLRMRPERVIYGFNLIAPVLAQAFSQNNSAIVGSIGRNSVGDFIGSARKLFS